MIPTYQDGDRLLLDKRSTVYKRGDVVSFHDPGDPARSLVVEECSQFNGFQCFRLRMCATWKCRGGDGTWFELDHGFSDKPGPALREDSPQR